MENKKSIVQDGNTNVHLGLVILASAILIVTIYLIQHYFEIIYPTGLSGGSLCDINSFFNCDAATHSNVSNLFGVPIAVFGFMIGIFLFSNYLFKSLEVEGSLYFVLLSNALGCFALALYSLIALGSLCPFCTLYYILSFLTLALFHFKSDYKTPSIKILAFFGVAQLIAASGFYFYNQSKQKDQLALSESLIKEFYSYNNLGTPKILSPHRITSATENFADAPLQISIFSDFQCPACKALSEIVGPISRKYNGKVNIQYYFYPLDSNCNPQMTHSLHPSACEAAYVASCSGNKFSEVHDYIFSHQSDLNTEWLGRYAKELGVSDCVKLEETKKKVIDLINVGTSFNVQSTPTLLINGVKIEGVLPLNQFYIILDDILKKNGK